MKTKTIFVTMTLIMTVLVLPATGQKVKFKSAEDSLSYALGVANFRYYQDDSISINTKMFAKGMADAEKNTPVMNETDASAFVVAYMQEREKARLMAEYRVKIEEAGRFFAANSKAEGVITTASGLQYKVITPGTGIKPGPDDVVTVHYTGTTIDGARFDSSYDRGEPAKFRVKNVIAGWVEGLQLMTVGSKYILYIPAELAYGERGAGNVIKPFEPLIFEVELIDVTKE